MKTTTRKTCFLLSLTIAFALTLAMAGNVLACPCSDIKSYNGFDYAGGLTYSFGSPMCDPNTTYLDTHSSLTLGSGTWGSTYPSQSGPGGVDTPWMLNQWYDVNGYSGYSKYAIDLHTAVAQNGAGPFTATLTAAGAALVFVNGSSTPSLSLGFPNPSSWTPPWNETTNPFPSDQFATGQFNLDFATQANSFGNIPIEVVYFFDKKTYPNQVASGFDLVFSQNLIIPHENCDPTSTPVPEPATMLLLGSGLVGLAGLKRKFRKS